MNLTIFLKQTDAMTAKYSAEQLASFIHETGRILPEHCREDFLKRLAAAGEGTEKTADTDQTAEFDFMQNYQLIRENLKRIDSQEVTISGILNEEYDDWYDDGEEFYYEDDSGVSDMIEEACDFVHTSMDREKYKEGFEIGSQLFAMEILCMNEYGDEEFYIRNMVEIGLLHCDIKQAILDTLYCGYHALPLEKRPEGLYMAIMSTGEKEVTLEAVMQHGEEELPDFQNFLIRWIAYVGDRTGSFADRLLLEAVGLLNDASLAVEYARRFASMHPGLYLKLLENRIFADADDMVSLGMDAVKTIPKKYVARSRAALKTAEYAMEAEKDQSLLESCYFAAFESDTSALNYMRALLNGSDVDKQKQDMCRYFTVRFAGKGGARDDGWGWSAAQYSEKENRPDGNTILLLRFLDGQFADVLKQGLNKSEALGWSESFMKQGIALYLLCIYEGAWQRQGIKAMVDIVKREMGFSVEEYRRGLCEPTSADEDDLFYDLFTKWKSIVPMEETVKTSAMKKITGLLEKRTEGIMNANRRNYYGECAAYIAALGEVRESLGSPDAKQRLMTSYKEKYVRRNAFRAEMKRYGWIDVKKR